MSEYQYYGFRAIEKPISEANLAYMHQQSTRAEITPWAFDNEYHYGDFRGNATEMILRGYHLHLQYANFAIRNLFIQLPDGIPDANLLKPYVGEDSLGLVNDKNGRGRILAIEPYFDGGEIDELMAPDEFPDRLIPLRGEIINGDLRPLYLAHLAISRDSNHSPDEAIEAPVPAGLKELTSAQSALAEFYDLSDELIAAAAEASPPLPKKGDVSNLYDEWLRKMPQATKDAWLADWMADPHSSSRSEILTAFRKNQNVAAWPTVTRNRTIAELETAAEEIRQGVKRKASEKAAREKAKRLTEMTNNPLKFIAEIEKLVGEKSTHSYLRAAEILSDLRESLKGTDQSLLPAEVARRLQRTFPSRRTLVSELRKKGFLPK